jgi:hypothetical protein
MLWQIFHACGEAIKVFAIAKQCSAREWQKKAEFTAPIYAHTLTTALDELVFLTRVKTCWPGRGSSQEQRMHRQNYFQSREV